MKEGKNGPYDEGVKRRRGMEAVEKMGETGGGIWAGPNSSRKEASTRFDTDEASAVWEHII